ncbi:sterol uptake control protein 2 [Podospora australis]|uniref:Sterol uptake control protein 2 n=1 Tax=Podospora australis TaxID=1536484 RepID=A0AAN6WMU2_9PEZI|nr:sterol uptake control protein 2 [Podospora australis]
MARLKLGYTKSRGGCLRCKQRRVKCDENKPCRACVRHGVECSLVSSSSQSNSSSAASTPSAVSPVAPTRRTLRALPSHNLRRSTVNKSSPPPTTSSSSLSHVEPSIPAQSDPFPYFTRFGHGSSSETNTTDWVSDLELLHQWSTATFKTMAVAVDSGKMLDHLWQVEVPQQAFRHVFLLHQILAISAYHLAYLRPENRRQYSLRASYHQSLAIQGIRSALTNISADNCHALFATSALLFISALAATRLDDEPENAGPSIDSLLDVFMLVKGIGGVINSSNNLVRTGPFHELFLRHDGPKPHFLALDRIMQQLEGFLNRIVQLHDEMDDITDPVRNVIRRETDCLIDSIREAVANSVNPEYRIVAAWPFKMTDEYIPLLRQRNPVALALLSYYCVILHSAEPTFWYMKGWGEGVIRDISRAVVPPWNQDSAWAIGWMTSAEEAPTVEPNGFDDGQGKGEEYRQFSTSNHSHCLG